MRLPDLNEFAIHPALAAVAGSLLGLKALPGATLPERLADLAAGFFIAFFAGPGLVEHMGIESPKGAAGVIFMLGAAGLVIFGALIDAIRRTDLGAWFANWLPQRKSRGGDQQGGQ